MGTMSRIRTASTDLEHAGIKGLFERLKKKFGLIPNAHRTYALWPEYLEAMDKVHTLAFERESALDPKMKNLIALLVYRLNHCHYCYAWQSLILRQLGVESDVITAISDDFHRAPISDEQKEILCFVEKIVRSPFAISDKDVKDLHASGFSDEIILEIAVTAGTADSHSRVVLALGVSFET